MKATPKTVAVLSRYTSWHRAIDLSAIALFGALSLWNLAQLAAGLERSGQIWLTGTAALAAWLAVDLLSGLVHWAFDTWGSVHTPVVGARYIRPFREHHWDPHAMTRHDFVETNGSSCVGALPLLGIAAVLPVDARGPALAHAVLVFIALGVLVTNQCHKWAHLPPRGHSTSGAPGAAAAVDPAAGRSSAASRAAVRLALLHRSRLAEPAAGCGRILSRTGTNDRDVDAIARPRRRSRLRGQGRQGTRRSAVKRPADQATERGWYG